MQKTNKELAEFYGIKVGDTVKIVDDDGATIGTFLVKDLEAACPLKVISYHTDPRLSAAAVSFIGSKKYEVIKPKKKVGETLCSERLCSKCPLHILYCYQCLDNFDVNWPLYRILNEIAYKGGLKSDNPIYLAFRAELDKEVE